MGVPASLHFAPAEATPTRSRPGICSGGNGHPHRPQAPVPSSRPGGPPPELGFPCTPWFDPEAG